jgi:hypothetical protein
MFGKFILSSEIAFMVVRTRFLQLTCVCLIIWSLLCASGGELFAATVVVTDIKGKVTFAGGRSVEILDEYDSGAELWLEGGSELTLVYLKSGASFQVGGRTHATIRNDAPVLFGGGKVFKNASKLNMELATLNMSGGRITQGAVVMRGPERVEELMQPQNKLVSLRPKFLWPVPSQDSHTIFKLSDEISGNILFEEDLTGSSFQLPARLMLEPEKSYVWSIQIKQGKKLSRVFQAFFSIGCTAELEYFEKLRPANDAPFSDRLIYAGLLEQAQFFNEAKVYWQQLAVERPDMKTLREFAPESQMTWPEN